MDQEEIKVGVNCPSKRECSHKDLIKTYSQLKI